MHSILTQNFTSISIRGQIQIKTTVLPLKLIPKTGGTQASAKGENISNLDDACLHQLWLTSYNANIKA